MTKLDVPGPSLKEFLRRLLADWASLLSGGLSVPATFMSYYFESRIAKLGFATLAVCLFAYATYRVWAGERRNLTVFINEFGESLPETAPQPSLESETTPDFGPVNRLILHNNSSGENIFNIVFQPQRLLSGIHITWHPETLAILSAGEAIVVVPQAFVANNGSAQIYTGVSSLRTLLASSGFKPEYDIGPIAFTCEDSRQNRYLVTFTGSINLNGNTFKVRDLDRRRIGSRQAIR